MNEKKEKRKMRNTEGRGEKKKRKPGFIQKNTLFWNGCWKWQPSSKGMATVHKGGEKKKL